MRERYGNAALPNAIISKTDGASDLLEVALLLKEAGLLLPATAAGTAPQLALNIIPLFETIDQESGKRRLARLSLSFSQVKRREIFA